MKAGYNNFTNSNFLGMGSDGLFLPNSVVSPANFTISEMTVDTRDTYCEEKKGYYKVYISKQLVGAAGPTGYPGTLVVGATGAVGTSVVFKGGIETNSSINLSVSKKERLSIKIDGNDLGDGGSRTPTTLDKGISVSLRGRITS